MTVTPRRSSARLTVTRRLSPAPIMIVVGVVLGQAFLAWSKKRQATQKTPLIALEVIETPQQRSAVFSMFMIVVLGSDLAQSP